jgi:murein DD-endopeptidase MepM/ murein hydrolase activator NlpD
MFDAESRLDGLTIELAAAEDDLLVLEAEVSDLRDDLAESAVRQYTGAGEPPMMLFQDIGLGTERSVARVYAGAATGSQLVQADDYDEALRELDEARHSLERQRDDTVEARETWTALKAAAEAEVLDLQRIEQERLADAQVQHELERQRQERAERQREEAERRAAAAAAARSSAPPGGNAGSTRAVAAPAGNSTSDAASPTPSPAPSSAPNAGAGMVCPVAGPRSFADTWGAPRSGGRSHEGVDMMAAGGTPLVAVEAGSATFKTNRLGGNAVWITGNSGTKYYYAHLSAWEGSSRTVSQGEVIGYVGATGNTSVNHLHFEVHPNGGRAVNPYPYVRAVC